MEEITKDWWDRSQLTDEEQLAAKQMDELFRIEENTVMMELIAKSIGNTIVPDDYLTYDRKGDQYGNLAAKLLYIDVSSLVQSLYAGFIARFHYNWVWLVYENFGHKWGQIAKFITDDFLEASKKMDEEKKWWNALK